MIIGIVIGVGVGLLIGGAVAVYFIRQAIMSLVGKLWG